MGLIAMGRRQSVSSEGWIDRRGCAINWLPTDPERRFFLIGRFYGPEPAIVNGSFELNDIELID
jgi:hypothetical protein